MNLAITSAANLAKQRLKKWVNTATAPEDGACGGKFLLFDLFYHRQTATVTSLEVWHLSLGSTFSTVFIDRTTTASCPFD